MSKKNSYSDLMKRTVMDRNKNHMSYMQNLFIDMLLNEVTLTHSLKRLEREIDQALDDRNEILFRSLSAKRKELVTRYGT
ncbi:IDEAL domain-containing protein [Peribacillus sp. SCS-37]|uniref:IDEAL domain-containing protein n=1 Tax=Paraperibacillus esterisolvens TaxID=3115296 RepID=UPI00390586AB